MSGHLRGGASEPLSPSLKDRNTGTKSIWELILLVEKWESSTLYRSGETVKKVYEITGGSEGGEARVKSSPSHIHKAARRFIQNNGLTAGKTGKGPT